MSRQIRFAAVLQVVLCAGQILAQSTTEVPAPGQQTPKWAIPAQSAKPSQPDAQALPDAQAQQADPVEATTQEEEPSQEQAPQPQYAPSLDGSGLIALGAMPRLQLLFGGTASSGFDTNPENLSNGQASAIYSFSPYLSVQTNTGRTQFLLQYQPTIIEYSSYAGNNMQVASARADGSFRERWKWTMSVSGNRGSDSIRLLAPAQTVAIGGVEGSGPSAASYLPNAGTLTDVDGGLGVDYELSPRDAVSFKLGNSYDTLSTSNMTGAVATANIKYIHALSPSLNVFGYQQTSKYYLDLNCAAFGAGAGLRWLPREGSTLSIQGGPQINTSGCKGQQGFAYGASFSTMVPGRAQVYFTADRQAVTGYLGPGLFQNDLSAGYQREFQSSNILAFDVGYVQSSSLVNYASYSGTYFDSSYGRTLRTGLSIRCSYRVYTGTLGTTSFSRNLASVSMNWTPNFRTMSR